MAQTEPAPQQYRGLCETAARIHRLAPWEWLSETDLFGVRHPEWDQTGWISLLGMLEAYSAVAVLLGDEALEQYRRIHEREDEDPERIYEELAEIPQLHLALVDRAALEPEDRRRLKEVGVVARGRGAWPQFRAFGSGLAERPIERTEATFLQHCLDQVLEVAPRALEDEEVLYRPKEDELLVRVWQDGVWRDHYETPAPVTLPWERVEASPFSLSQFRQLTPTGLTLELDFYHLWSQVTGESDLPPFHPYLLVAADAANGLVLGMEMLKPAPSFETMWQQVPAHLARLLGQAGGLPATVLVESKRLMTALGPLMSSLQVTLVEVRSLPHLKELRESIGRDFDGIPDVPAEPAPNRGAPGERDRLPSPDSGRMIGGSGCPGPLPLPDWADANNPLDLAAVMLQSHTSSSFPKAARSALDQALRKQHFSTNGPGTILRDLETFLRAIGDQPLQVTAGDGVPRGRFMAAVNRLLAAPFPEVSRQPSPRSFPNVRGLYHLLHSAGFGWVEFGRPLFMLNHEAIAEWRSLNPTEQYFILLEAWLLSPDPDLEPLAPGGLLTPLLRFLHLEAELANDSLRPLDYSGDYHLLRLSFGLTNLSLAAAFGLVTRTATEGGIASLPEVATAFAMIEPTRWGQQCGTRLQLYLSQERGKRESAEARRHGGLMPVWQPLFPAWKRRLSRTPWMTANSLEMPEADGTNPAKRSKRASSRNAAVLLAAAPTSAAGPDRAPTAPQAEEGRPTVVLKVALHKSWRRLAVPVNTSLHELAQAIIAAFDFSFDHLYAFYRGTRPGEGPAIGHPGLDESQRADRTRVADLELHPGDRLVLLYDFGDEWLFRLQVEEVGLTEGNQVVVLERQGRPPTQYPG